MPACIGTHKPLLPLRVGLIAALTVLLSGWTTCMGAFFSCQSSTAQPEVNSLSPGTIFIENESTVLQVDGSNFEAQSQITWNGHALQTTFVNSHRLETTITAQTFASFGGTAGGTAQISVVSPDSGDIPECRNRTSSTSLLLMIQ